MNYQNEENGETILTILLNSNNKCDVKMIELLLSVNNINIKLKNKQGKNALQIMDKNGKSKDFQSKEIQQSLANYVSLKNKR